MKTKIQIEKEIEITHIELTLPVRFGDEDMPFDFPLREGDIWQARINIDTGEILGFPKDYPDSVVYLKVCDEGIYRLFTYRWERIAELKNEYVPHGVVPGDYGDYVRLVIKKGVVVNWPKKPDVRKFFARDEE